jgi:hypothetical protein
MCKATPPPEDTMQIIARDERTGGAVAVYHDPQRQRRPYVVARVNRRDQVVVKVAFRAAEAEAVAHAVTVRP